MCRVGSVSQYAALRACVTDKLGLPASAEPTPTQLATVTDLSCTGRGIAEADYVFPLPAGAAFEDLKLMINGELVSGETMTADDVIASVERWFIEAE